MSVALAMVYRHTRPSHDGGPSMRRIVSFVEAVLAVYYTQLQIIRSLKYCGSASRPSVMPVISCVPVRAHSWASHLCSLEFGLMVDDRDAWNLLIAEKPHMTSHASQTAPRFVYLFTTIPKVKRPAKVNQTNRVGQEVSSSVSLSRSSLAKCL